MDSWAALRSRGQGTVAGTTASPNRHHNSTNCTLFELPQNSVQNGLPLLGT